MKKLISIIILCFLPWLVEARICNVVVGQGVAAGTTAYCTGAATCTATNPDQCDILCEDFEGTSECDADSSPDMDAVCRNQYAVVIGASSAMDFTSTATGTYPCASTTNTNVLKITQVTTDGNYALFDAGAGKPINYTQFYLKINSDSMASGNAATVFMACTTANCSTYAWKVVVRESAADTKYLDMTYYNGTAFTTKAGVTELGTTWHRIQVMHDYTNSKVRHWVDGTPQQDEATDVGNRQPQYFGPRTESYTIEVEYDNWAIDATGTQGACQ